MDLAGIGACFWKKYQKNVRWPLLGRCRPGSANPWILAIWLKKSAHKVEGSHATRFGPIDYSSGGFYCTIPKLHHLWGIVYRVKTWSGSGFLRKPLKKRIFWEKKNELGSSYQITSKMAIWASSVMGPPRAKVWANPLFLWGVFLAIPLPKTPRGIVD